MFFGIVESAQTLTKQLGLMSAGLDSKNSL